MRGQIISLVIGKPRASGVPLIIVLIGIVVVIMMITLPAMSKSAECDERLLTFVQKLANSPNLLSYPYLVNALGSPSKVTVLPSGTARQAQWFELNGCALRYCFEQEFGPLIKAGDVQNKLDVYLSTNDGISCRELSAHFGKPAFSAFDGRYEETLTFRMAPYTILEVRRLNCARFFAELTLTYCGPVKPAPSEEDCLSALTSRRAKALAQYETCSDARAASLLSAYLQDAPGDAEAHLKLGEAYKNSGCLNEAIRQFRLAYTLPSGDEQIHKTALERLKAFSIAPARQDDQETLPSAGFDKISVAGIETIIDVGF